MRVPEQSGILWVDITCEETTERWRSPFVEGRAVALDVPFDGDDFCLAILKGPSAQRRVQVAGGNAYDCELDELVTNCVRGPVGE